MRTEELKNKITIQKFIITGYENGFEVGEWQDFIICFARIETIISRKNFIPEKTLKFTTRFLKSIEITMRIKFREKLYNINLIDNIKYENRYTEIRALEVQQSGQD